MVTMGHDATVLPVTLEMMPTECLQNCPRNVDCAYHFQRYEEYCGIITLLHGLSKFDFLCTCLFN